MNLKDLSRRVLADACMLELSLKALNNEVAQSNTDRIEIAKLITEYNQFTDKLNRATVKYVR